MVAPEQKQQTFHGKTTISRYLPSLFSGKVCSAIITECIAASECSRGQIKINLPPAEARVRAIAEVVQALISGVRDGRDVDLNNLKGEVARRYNLSRLPKLVEIIAAVPEEHKAMLLPQLRAKPVRTASGIAVVAVMSKPHRCPHIATTGVHGHMCNPQNRDTIPMHTCLGMTGGCRNKQHHACMAGPLHAHAWEVGNIIITQSSY